MRIKAFLIVSALLTLIFIISGCNLIGTKKKEWMPSVPQKRPFVHVITYSGETLRIISQWYTGDADNWEILSDANPYIDYDKLMPGDKIFIPEYLLRTRNPMTEEYIEAYYKKEKPNENQKKKKSSSKTETQPEKKEEFDLIGPK